MARETVLSWNGELLELRGDEALCVFGSARQALRAAVELQTRFRERKEDGPAFPLPIGIGLDAGEAVPIEGGYRGGALNTAARLCSLAGPGQILATETVVSLARRLDGIRFVERRPVRLKGLEKPIRPIEVLPEIELPPVPEIAAPKPSRTTRQTAVLAAVVVGASLAAAVVGFVINRSLGQDFLSELDANSIGVINAQAMRVTDELPSVNAPTAIAQGGGYVWVASEANGTVSRVHPATHAAQTLSLGGSAGGIAYGGGSVWVTRPNERRVVQIDPDTLTVVQTLPVGNAPGAVAADARAVWVTNTFDGTVSRIPLRRDSATKTISVAARPAGIAVGAGAVWVSDEVNGNVLRVDPGSGRVVEAISVGNGPTGVAVSDGRVWVANRQDGTVSRIDADTSRVSAAITVGADPAALAAGAGSVWVASEGDRTIARLDAATGDVEKTLSLAVSPHSLALLGADLWVATLASPASHRGGVLRIESDPSQCRCTDPGYFSEIANITDQTVVTFSYDGLVAYRRTGGVAGGALVGDLAVRVPVPTDGGRAYTFKLRPDVRFSNGAPVRAADVRYSLERALTVNRDNALRYYGAIVGAAACGAGPAKRCRLERGIEVDDETRRVTIHLTEPDPDFAHNLAVPLGSVVPAGTPLAAARSRPIPGTGPYRVASFAPTRAVRLVRNPYFRVWSPDARPDGYPDDIRLHLSEDSEAKVAAVEEVKSDWTDVVASELPAGRVQSLLTRHASQLRSDPIPLTFWYFLNTRVPPFDDIRARRALNYALDRASLVETAGGALYRPAACQFLPPSFPGYSPYCPYTRAPTPAGAWTAPNLARAHALVAASGTRGMRVEVVGLKSVGAERAARTFVSELTRLGYRASLRLFPDFGTYLAYVSNSRNRAQLGQWGWLADTLTPSGFLRSFSCAAFQPGTSANENPSELCDRDIDAAMRRAASLQTSDPARSNELWAEIDRMLLDRAAGVPAVGGRALTLVSERVGNNQSHPLWGTLLDQLWVK